MLDHNSNSNLFLSATAGNPSDDVIGDTYFYSMRCIFNKVVTFYTHLYYLCTWPGTFAHPFRTPLHQTTVVDPGGVKGAMAPVEISHKKDGCQRRPYRFHVSWPPYPAAGSDAGQFNKLTYTHLYYLSTSLGAFARLGRNPLHQTI